MVDVGAELVTLTAHRVVHRTKLSKHLHVLGLRGADGATYEAVLKRERLAELLERELDLLLRDLAALVLVEVLIHLPVWAFALPRFMFHAPACLLVVVYLGLWGCSSLKSYLEVTRDVWDATPDDVPAMATRCGALRHLFIDEIEATDIDEGLDFEIAKILYKKTFG